MLLGMSVALIVPTLAAGPFRIRPFMLADIDAVREASRDPYIPLITTVPAAFTEDEGSRFIERQWGRAEQGTGYSFAIADARTDRAVGQVGLWLQLYVELWNTASIRTAEEAGYRPEGLLRGWQEGTCICMLGWPPTQLLRPRDPFQRAAAADLLGGTPASSGTPADLPGSHVIRHDNGLR